MRSLALISCLLATAHAVHAHARDAQLAFSVVRPTSTGEDPLSFNAAHLSLEDRIELELYLDTYSEPRLVQLRQEPTPRWITEGEKALLVWNHVRFVDVTDDDQTHDSQLQAPTSVTYPGKLSHDEKHLRGLFKRIDLGAMKQLSVALLSPDRGSVQPPS